MISGWVWALKMCPCTREASPNLWRPSRMSTSFSLVLRSPVPTRSLWMRGRCSLKRHRYLIFSVNIRLCRFVRGIFASLLTVCFVCTLPGWRDHKDHESLHKHDREEALQREVCVQLWKQLDQVIDLAGHKMYSAAVHPTENEQTWRGDAEKCSENFNIHCVSELLTGNTEKLHSEGKRWKKVGTLKHLSRVVLSGASLHAVSELVTRPH